MGCRLSEASEVEFPAEKSVVKGSDKMELPGGGFDSRPSEHIHNTEVLLALINQNKSLEGLNKHINKCL